MRSPWTWWRDRRDPLRDLEPTDLSSDPMFAGIDFEPDEANTELRDTIVELAEAEARGGVDEVFKVIREQYARKRDDARFERETKQLTWTKVGVWASVIAAVTGIVAVVLGIAALTKP